MYGLIVYPPRGVCQWLICVRYGGCGAACGPFVFWGCGCDGGGRSWRGGGVRNGRNRSPTKIVPKQPKQPTFVFAHTGLVENPYRERVSGERVWEGGYALVASGPRERGRVLYIDIYIYIILLVNSPRVGSVWGCSVADGALCGGESGGVGFFRFGGFARFENVVV